MWADRPELYGVLSPQHGGAHRGVTTIAHGRAADGATLIAEDRDHDRLQLQHPVRGPADRGLERHRGAGHATVEGVWGAGVVPNDDECWLRSSTSASAPNGSFVNMARRRPLTALRRTASSAT